MLKLLLLRGFWNCELKGAVIHVGVAQCTVDYTWICTGKQLLWLPLQQLFDQVIRELSLRTAIWNLAALRDTLSWIIGTGLSLLYAWQQQWLSLLISPVVPPLLAAIQPTAHSQDPGKYQWASAAISYVFWSLPWALDNIPSGPLGFLGTNLQFSSSDLFSESSS